MKIYLVCMATETTAVIDRIYTKASLARKSLMGRSNSDTLKWGLVTLDLVTAEGPGKAEKLIEMTDDHLEDAGGSL